MHSQSTDDRLPPGNRDYIREPAVARGYDASLQDSVVAQHDTAIVEQYLQRLSGVLHPCVADFGCGTGRSLVPAVQRGYLCLGIDLSLPMLAVAREKLSQIPTDSTSPRSEVGNGGNWALLHANLLELQGLRPGSVDLALCLFSTFGMIRGANQRARLLQGIRTSLKDDGRLLIHGHNVWHQAGFPGGKRWLFMNWLQSRLFRSIEFGDRYADHPLIKRLFLHSFSERGFRAELVAAGWIIERAFPVADTAESGRRRSPVGWLMACRKAPD